MLNNVTSATVKEVQQEILEQLEVNGAQSDGQLSRLVFGGWQNRITANLTSLKKRGFVAKPGGHTWSAKYEITLAGSRHLKSLKKAATYVDPSPEYKWIFKSSSVNSRLIIGAEWEPFAAAGSTIYFRQLVEA